MTLQQKKKTKSQPRPNMTNRDFIWATLDDCMKVARWGGRSQGPGVVILDRRPADSYLISYVAIAPFLQEASDVERTQATSWLGEVSAGCPEMGMILLLIDARGNKQLFLIVPPRTACWCPFLQ